MSQPEEFDLDALGELDLDSAEKAAEAKGALGGEAIADGEADCEGCKI
ncbi:hypothetical protein AH06_115 [Erwinia phage AH06]|nr:hypothetical protein AH06_115 [Erwinia phage AH06]